MRIGSFRKTACFYALCIVATTAFGVQPNSTVTGGCEIAAAVPAGLTLKLNGQSGAGQLVFLYDEEPLDLSAFSHFALDTQSHVAGRVDIKVNIASDLENVRRSVDGRFFLEPGETEEIRMLMFRNYLPETSPWVDYFGELRALPGYQGKWLYIEPKQILRVRLDIAWSDLNGSSNRIRFSLPEGSGEFVIDSSPPAKKPQPLVDEAGQLVNEEWEGKLEQLSDLPKEGKADLATYSKSRIQPGFSQYGGWLDGPRYKVTGQFYTKKIEGKWWFVDPEGYLFWSLGVTGAGSGAATRLTGREHLFPASIANPHPQKGWRPGSFNFFDSNLKRKYGKEWEQAHSAVTLGRMQEWGLNTCGAWPRGAMLNQQRVPYTLMITPQLQTLGTIDKIPDPFSEEFRTSLQEKMAAAGRKHAGDPWNLGIFTGNEMHWYGTIRLPLEIAGLEPSVPAKRAMIKFMQNKYGTVKALNKAWGSAFPAFDELRDPEGDGPEQNVFWKDLEAYFAHFCDTYFSLCDAALEEYFPGHLYLGCRFHSDVYGKQNPIVQRAAAQYCDAISVNGYEYSMNNFYIPPDIDCPYLVGEFHFGTSSHGVWGSGMLGARDLEHQAELYETYVKEVLNNPRFVGAHWFQWADHAAMGREDGENYRVGLVSTVDRPYEKLVNAVQKTAQGMYQQRSGTKDKSNVNVSLKTVTSFRTADVFTSGMVLQREIALPVWGTAPDGTAVTVLLGTNRADTVAAKERWSTQLPAMRANSVPQTLTVIYNDTVTNSFTNVLLGDVWIVSGQSNAGVSVKEHINANPGYQIETLNKVRFFKQGDLRNGSPSVTGKWFSCGGNGTEWFSATDYFMGIALHHDKNRSSAESVGNLRI